MITPEWLTAITTTLYTVVTLVTLFLIRKQLKDVNKNILSSTYQSMYESMISIDRFFIDNPSLKFYFYCNPEELPTDPKERQQLLSIAEMMVDFFDCVYYQRDCMREETFKAKMFYFADIYNKSPAIREYLAQPNLDRWYSSEFLSAFKLEAERVRQLSAT